MNVYFLVFYFSILLSMFLKEVVFVELRLFLFCSESSLMFFVLVLTLLVTQHFGVLCCNNGLIWDFHS